MKKRAVKKWAINLHYCGDADYVRFCYNKLRRHFFIISEPSGRHYLSWDKVINYLNK